MIPIPLNIAVEDLLSEAVCKRLLAHSSRPFSVGAVFGRGGFGYLKRTAPGWNAAARGTPFLLLTDLDQTPCASELIARWFAEPLHPNLMFRVAVREVEAWLMGDRLNLSRFLKVKESKVPDFPETLIDAKGELLRLAASSRSADIRNRLLPKRGSLAQQGPDYNGCLIDFVYQSWNISDACAACPSLDRCVDRLKHFEPVWT